MSKIPVRIFHAHGASITKDWKLPIKLVCKACLPTNMTHHFSCGVEAAKCYFGQKVVDENDYVLIPNAIDVERFIYNPEIRNKIRKENDLENKHVVGHVGRFMAQKNHTFLLDVFAEVLKIDSQAHLVLLGDGELMDEIKRKTADLGISEHVTFVGNVGNANEWYQAFDCFVLPSIWEGLVFNKALMEKLKQYKPSVISMHDSWISFVCLAVNGFFYSDQNAYIMYRQHDANVLGAQRHSLKDTLMGIVKNKNVLRSDMAKEILKGYSEMMPEKTKEAFITFAEYKENLKYKLKILMLPYNKKKTTKRTFEKVKLRIVFNTI